MSLSTAPIVKNTFRMEFTLSSPKKHPRRNLTVFQYHFWTSLKRLKKLLSFTVNFNTFLQFSSSNFILKLC